MACVRNRISEKISRFFNRTRSANGSWGAFGVQAVAAGQMLVAIEAPLELPEQEW